MTEKRTAYELDRYVDCARRPCSEYRSEHRTIFEASRPGAPGYRLPDADIPVGNAEIPEALLRKTPAALPELSEIETVRHFTNLSRRNYGVDLGFYPLGSCTMKYNPKVNEDAAALPGFTSLHPLQSDEDAAGTLELNGKLMEVSAKSPEWPEAHSSLWPVPMESSSE